MNIAEPLNCCVDIIILASAVGEVESDEWGSLLRLGGAGHEG